MAKRGGFPGGMPGNMANLMKQAQKMQRQMEEQAKEWRQRNFLLQQGRCGRGDSLRNKEAPESEAG